MASRRLEGIDTNKQAVPGQIALPSATQPKAGTRHKLTWDVLMCRAALWEVPWKGTIQEVQPLRAAGLVLQAVINGRPHLISLCKVVSLAEPTAP